MPPNLHRIRFKQAGAELGQAQPELGLKVVIWSWGLKLKLEFADCIGRLKLKFQVLVWGISELYCEAEMFKLKFDIGAWNWSLRSR